MKLKPLFDRVVVKEITQEETTVGGIFLPTAAKEKQERKYDHRNQCYSSQQTTRSSPA